MEKYIPPFKISNKMVQLVSSISEKIGEIDNREGLESKPHLRRNNRIKSIHASLKIEANSLSLTQVRDVIDGHLVLGSQLEIQEVKNAYKAYAKIGEVNPYSLKDLKELHGIMTAGIVNESGEFRHEEEGVFSGEKCIFVAPPPQMVSGLMKDLFCWMKENKEKVHPLILAAVFHYEFVFIHPFSDGNGRMARLWHTILLANWRDIFAYIPLESQIEKFQEEYYQVIAQCHSNGDSNEFIEFILEQIDFGLSEIIEQLKRTDIETSEYVRKMLSVMEYDVPYTSESIMVMLGLKSKETFRKNYMNPAMEQGYIIMTIPDKPRSRNQRYVKKKN